MDDYSNGRRCNYLRAEHKTGLKGCERSLFLAEEGYYYLESESKGAHWRKARFRLFLEVRRSLAFYVNF